MVCALPCWRLWQNCHFHHICQIRQDRQLLWAPLLLCALPCWRLWQNCHFRHICQIRQHVLFFAIFVVVCISGHISSPPMWLMIDFRTRRNMWVEFVVGSPLSSERFFSGYSRFPLSSKTNISKFTWTNRHSVEGPLQISLNISIIVKIFAILSYRLCFVFRGLLYMPQWWLL